MRILEHTFEDSAPFDLTNRPSLLVATVRVVQRTRTGQHVQIHYVVDIARHGRVIGTTDGSCEMDSLARCAAAVVRDTRYFLDGVR
ncbi:MAG TPA: hypothetical protein VHX52_08360 [Steroidobacteraceae bacterium]|nr:hypothetical protein [Steroidobacteraceae bacterium]